MRCPGSAAGRSWGDGAGAGGWGCPALPGLRDASAAASIRLSGCTFPLTQQQVRQGEGLIQGQGSELPVWCEGLGLALRLLGDATATAVSCYRYRICRTRCCHAQCPVQREVQSDFWLCASGRILCIFRSSSSNQG